MVQTKANRFQQNIKDYRGLKKENLKNRNLKIISLKSRD